MAQISARGYWALKDWAPTPGLCFPLLLRDVKANFLMLPSCCPGLTPETSIQAGNAELFLVHMRTHTYVFTHKHTHICSHTCTHLHYSCSHTHVYTYPHVLTSVYIYTPTHECTHYTHKYTPIKHFVSFWKLSEDLGATRRCSITQSIASDCPRIPSIHSLCLLPISSLHSSSTASPQCQIFVSLSCTVILPPALELLYTCPCRSHQIESFPKSHLNDMFLHHVSNIGIHKWMAVTKDIYLQLSISHPKLTQFNDKHRF